MLLVIVTILISSGCCEIGLRLFFKDRLQIVEDERYLLYEYHETLGWFPIPESKQRLRASRVFTVIHNRLGFRAPEPEAGANTRPAIMFLGDSYVWGYDVDAEERFTDKLQAKHPEWNVQNMGVSGYGTDQEYLLLQNYFETCKPRVVFLVFCTNNDDADNSTNFRYGGYYKPYCVTEDNRLQLRGVPVPRSERAWLAAHQKASRSYFVRLLIKPYFKLKGPPVVHNPSPTGAIIRDMQKYLESKGAVFLVGLTESNPKLQEFLDFFKIPHIDLSTPLRYPDLGNHWTPDGHTFVCDKVDEFLAKGHWMNITNWR